MGQSENDITTMPWGLIVKRTAQFAVGSAAFWTFVGAMAARAGRRAKAEAERPRWTDANRWEK